jgi:chromosomal replication initiator protein
MIGQRSISIVEVQWIVASAFHLSRAELLSHSRRQHVAYARHVAMYLSRVLVGRPTDDGECTTPKACASFPRIGRAFDRDHSSVIHACNAIERRRQCDLAFGHMLDSMTQDVRGRICVNAALEAL